MQSVPRTVKARQTDTARMTVIRGGRVVTETGVLEGADLLIEGGKVVALGEVPTGGAARTVDARGKFVLPGIIDLHSDALEKFIEPRPGAAFPHGMAMYEFDKYIASCGITTMFHCICLMEAPEIRSVRSVDTSVAIVNELFERLPHLNVNTRIHARYDMPSVEALDATAELVRERRVHLLSFIDHTPGQGQYPNIDEFIKRRSATFGERGARKMLELRLERQRRIRTEDLNHLMALARERDIPMASHDDDGKEKVLWVHTQGIRISEFPVNMEALRAAREMNHHVCVGSPNVIRGKSHSNNISAREAVSLGLADILCSDYAPMTMLHAVFMLAEMGIGALHDTVKLVSLNPAGAVGIGETTGSIAVGKDADLIIVDRSSEAPRLSQTFVGGREVVTVATD